MAYSMFQPASLQFNRMLFQISQQLISDDDMYRLKALLVESIPRNELSNCRTSMDLFDLMTKEGLINHHNTGFLSDILNEMGRSDLGISVKQWTTASVNLQVTGVNDNIFSSRAIGLTPPQVPSPNTACLIETPRHNSSQSSAADGVSVPGMNISGSASHPQTMHVLPAQPPTTTVSGPGVPTDSQQFHQPQQHQELSDLLMWNLAEDLGASWEAVGYNLGMSQPDIERAKANDQFDMTKQAHSLLVQWRKQIPRQQNKKQLLAAALREAGCTEVAEKHGLQGIHVSQPVEIGGSLSPVVMPWGIALLVNDEWGTSKGGISTINRHIGGQVLPGHLKVYCMVVRADQDDIDDAASHGVTLILPKKLYDDNDYGTLKCLLHWKSYFEDVLQETLKPMDVRVVVGHADITHRAALEIKKKLYPLAKYASFFHVIPEDCETWKGKTLSTMNKKESDMYEHAKDEGVNAVFSVGPRIFEHYSHRLSNDRKEHLEYLPFPEPKFHEKNVTAPLSSRQTRILTFGRVQKVSTLKGFDIMARAVGMLGKLYESRGKDPPVWVVCGVPDEEANKTTQFLREHAKSTHLDVKLYPIISQNAIIAELQNCSICLMGSRTEPFGLVGLEAMVMGVPTLITNISGLAKLLLSHFESLSKLCVVKMPPSLDPGTISFEETAKQWMKEILDIIENPQIAFEKARRLKQALQQSAQNGVIKCSHSKFIQYCLQ